MSTSDDRVNLWISVPSIAARDRLLADFAERGIDVGACLAETLRVCDICQHEIPQSCSARTTFVCRKCGVEHDRCQDCHSSQSPTPDECPDGYIHGCKQDAPRSVIISGEHTQ